jgi:putative photosynthetic complex assembly protein 2
VRGRTGLASAAALGAALLGLVAFWWAATGVTIAMERDALTRAAGLAAATGLAALAVALLRTTRDVETPAAAFRSFAAGSLLWLWISTLFYGGWVTGVRPGGAAPAGPSLALAAQAIAGTLHADLLALGVIALAVRLTWRAPNRVGLWALLLFWGAHQTGKLNVFFGVRHAGAEFLPRELGYLSRFFGPPANSPLLPATVIALAALAGLLVWRAVKARTPFARAGHAMLGTLAALALLEHVLLGVEFTVPLWDAFLRARNA